MLRQAPLCPKDSFLLFEILLVSGQLDRTLAASFQQTATLDFCYHHVIIYAYPSLQHTSIVLKAKIVFRFQLGDMYTWVNTIYWWQFAAVRRHAHTLGV